MLEFFMLEGEGESLTAHDLVGALTGRRRDLWYSTQLDDAMREVEGTPGARLASFLVARTEWHNLSPETRKLRSAHFAEHATARVRS